MTRLSAADAADRQHAQDLFGRVGDRRQRIGRQHGETGDPGEPLVVGEMRGNGRADDQALDLRQERFVSHECLQKPTGLADGLEVGVLYQSRRSRAATGGRIRPWDACTRPVGPPYRADRRELGCQSVCSAEAHKDFVRTRPARPAV